MEEEEEEADEEEKVEATVEMKAVLVEVGTSQAETWEATRVGVRPSEGRSWCVEASERRASRVGRRKGEEAGRRL